MKQAKIRHSDQKIKEKYKNKARIQLARFHTEYQLGIRNGLMIYSIYEVPVTPLLQCL